MLVGGGTSVVAYFAQHGSQHSLQALTSWTLKVCKIMSFMAIFGGLGPLFYTLLRFR